jgi:methyltransferase-like protein
MLLKRRTNKEQPNIPFDNCFDFFKTLNYVPDECTIFSSLNPEDVNRLNEHINYAITTDEISTCIKKKYQNLLRRLGTE